MNTSVTVTEATYNVYFERTFNYTVYSQSRGRIYRPSQKYMCRTYHMTFNDSIDNLQLENLAQKGQIVNALLNKKFIDQGLWKKIFNANEGFTVE
jgi:SNF2 family DNA or RNA helicase